MSDVIQLNHQAENTYEFDLEVEGITSVDIRAWFVIIVKGMELAFPCTQDKNHFVCMIPPLPFIEKTAYKGAVRLVADDYFFEVVNDLIVNVMGNLSFERSDLKHMTVKTTLNGEPMVPAVGNSVTESATATVKTDVKRVETSAEISKRVADESKIVAGKHAKFSFDPRSAKKSDPVKSNSKSDDIVIQTNNKSVEKDITKDAEKDAAVKAAIKNVAKSNKASVDSSKFKRKEIPNNLKEDIPDTVDKNTLIEQEVSKFVSDEQSERSAKLRGILQSFTVAPESTPTKTRFIKKT